MELAAQTPPVCIPPCERWPAISVPPKCISHIPWSISYFHACILPVGRANLKAGHLCCSIRALEQAWGFSAFVISLILGAGELALQLRALPNLPENAGSAFPPKAEGSQLSVNSSWRGPHIFWLLWHPYAHSCTCMSLIVDVCMKWVFMTWHRCWRAHLWSQSSLSTLLWGQVSILRGKLSILWATSMALTYYKNSYIFTVFV